MTMKRIGIGQEWVSADKRAAREAVADAVAGRESVQPRASRSAETRLQTGAGLSRRLLRRRGAGAHHAHRDTMPAKSSRPAQGRLASATGSSAEVLGLDRRAWAWQKTSLPTSRQQQRAAAALPAALDRYAVRRAVPQPRTDAVPAQDAYVAVTPGRRGQAARHRGRPSAKPRRPPRTASPNWTWEVSYGQRTGYAGHGRPSA